ncbi:hypothetical protein [Actinomadura rudentiformis]|uniref:Uncharacterized protein n=1 Tax=Actinomadura rudentiformis TaxID=359158 RepID=A0A6H9YXA5_9ACTN|nr:hypothetical protein [Actinomadura rudentiformis]KAB2344802.1 hypothetical protein F8566_29835 [Actinomadura rudentiformis]
MAEPENLPSLDEVPSLEDEIFSVASRVENARDSSPRIRLPWDKAPQALDGRFILVGTAGFGTFVVIDVIMMWAPLMMSRRPSVLPQMVTLLLLAFGLGSLLIWKVGGSWRPFGIGMMFAWIFLTLISVGFLTGLTL